MMFLLHSYWAYLSLAILLVVFFNALFKLWGKKDYRPKDLRIALFSLIVTHIQLLLGLGWYFMSPSYQQLKILGMGEAMKNAEIRLLAVEHPVMMLIAIVLITIGYSRHKKKEKDSGKFRTLAIYYGIALILILSRIPWQQWFH